jgi:hypothetical protein
MTWGEVLKHNGWQFIVWIDQGLGGLVSTLLKELAFADLTLSANAWRWHVEGTRSWPRKLIDALFWWQDAHCYSSYVYEITRRHLPESMR